MIYKFFFDSAHFSFLFVYMGRLKTMLPRSCQAGIRVVLKHTGISNNFHKERLGDSSHEFILEKWQFTF